MSITNMTCEQVRQLVEACGKNWALVISGTPDNTQFVTWGRSATDKVYVSDLSDHLGKLLCGDEPPLVLESFHGKEEAAQNKARVEELEAEVSSLRQQIAGHVDRIAAQSELLTRRAEG